MRTSTCCTVSEPELPASAHRIISRRAGTGRRRIVLAGAAAVTVLAGLAVSTGYSGFAADAAADALYTALVYLLVALLCPRLRVAQVALLAFTLSAIIEFSQLTGLPAALAAVFPPARLIFGTTFVATDLLFYLVGAALIALVDVVVTRLLRRDRPGGTSRRP